MKWFCCFHCVWLYCLPLKPTVPWELVKGHLHPSHSIWCISSLKTLWGVMQLLQTRCSRLLMQRPLKWITVMSLGSEPFKICIVLFTELLFLLWAIIQICSKHVYSCCCSDVTTTRHFFGFFFSFFGASLKTVVISKLADRCCSECPFSAAATGCWQVTQACCCWLMLSRIVEHSYKAEITYLQNVIYILESRLFLGHFSVSCN